jgi:hypothetical protein
MSVPTVYSSAALQVYMLGQTGNLGTVLGLTSGDFAEAVTDTLLSYGEDTLADATDIAKLRALAKVAAWRVAVEKSTGYMKFTADGASFEAQTLHNQALASLALAESLAATYDGGMAGYVVSVGRLIHANDPYPLPVTDDDE